MTEPIPGSARRRALEDVRIRECPKRWAELDATEDPARRYCDACDLHVHDLASYTRSEAEALLARESPARATEAAAGVESVRGHADSDVVARDAERVGLQSASPATPLAGSGGDRPTADSVDSPRGAFGDSPVESSGVPSRPSLARSSAGPEPGRVCVRRLIGPDGRAITRDEIAPQLSPTSAASLFERFASGLRAAASWLAVLAAGGLASCPGDSGDAGSGTALRWRHRRVDGRPGSSYASQNGEQPAAGEAGAASEALGSTEAFVKIGYIDDSSIDESPSDKELEAPDSTYETLGDVGYLEDLGYTDG